MVLVKIEHFGRIIESFPTLHRNHSKWMIDLTLHLKSEMLKVLEENIGFQVIGMNKTFWTGEKIVQRANKWGYMKSKCFCTPKDKTAPAPISLAEWINSLQNGSISLPVIPQRRSSCLQHIKNENKLNIIKENCQSINRLVKWTVLRRRNTNGYWHF